MLKRKVYDQLLEWRSHHEQECLLIKGARQVGKSYIVDAFGSHEYASYIPINFLENPELKDIFAEGLSADDIYRRMTLLVPNARFVRGDTLVFLDEIQQCPQARTALKFLARDGRFDVIASGSLLGLQYGLDSAKDYSVPVGYERQIEMNPLDFEEYLWALGLSTDAVDVLRECFDTVEPVPKAAHLAMMGHLRNYLALGGMPAVIQRFVDTNDYRQAADEQAKILTSYEDDIARYARPTDRVKARACYLSLPRQLAKENTKFQYSVVSKGGNARLYGSAIDWLRDASVVRHCYCVSTPEFPLAAYEQDTRFRIYAADTGLLMAMYGFEMMAPVVNNTLKGPMKGGLYENLVADMLIANGHRLDYWVSRDASREIEFLLSSEGTIVPVEVKAGRGSTISLDSLLERDDIRRGYKLIDGNVGHVGKKVTLPLYMAMFL